jgi:hypothetical protein
MVTLRTASSGFEAQLLAARLGAEGIVWELRGNVGGPYPVGPVSVLVPEEQLDDALDLLLADEVEEVFAAPAHDGGGVSTRQPWVAVAVIALLVGFAVLRTLAVAG